MTVGAPAAVPLDGVRVLDLTRLLPGPLCSQLLADFGADVIKVEDLDHGDYARWTEPRHRGAHPSAASAFFIAHNGGKRSVRMDLKHPAGNEAFLRMVAAADVVIESFRPGVMARLGLDYDRLLGVNPSLVICPITGYGQTGPNAQRSGHDLNYLALSGVLSLSGRAAEPPTPMPVQVADVGGGALMAALGIVTALRHAERTGEGQVVDVAMFDGAMAWLSGPAADVLAGGAPADRGSLVLAGGAVCYATYACADGDVALGALEGKFWRAFCDGIARPDLVDGQFDPPGSKTHRELVEVFRSRTRDEWRAFADAHDCCLEPVLDVGEALASDLVGERELIVDVAQPGAEGSVRVIGTPVKFSRTPVGRNGRAAPALGEHTDEVLAELGFAAAEIRSLHDAGAVAGLKDSVAPTFLA